MKFTVLGSGGFIGGHATRYLQAQGHDVRTPARGESLKGENLGHVINAIGIVGGAKERQADMLDAHVALTQRLLSETDFESFLYISSTRLYAGLPTRASEEMPVPLMPSGHAVFDVSKLLGECVCLSFDNPVIRVARLSNTYGQGMNARTFLGSILKDLKEKGAVTIGEAAQSSKDYIAARDAVRVFEDIALKGRERIYNVASGTITTHAEIAAVLAGRGKVSFAENGPVRIFPRIDTARIADEFGGTFRRVTDDLPSL